MSKNQSVDVDSLNDNPARSTIALTLLIVGLIVPLACSQQAVSRLSGDEVVVFFPTSAWLNEADGIWNVPLRGWVYEPQNSSVRFAMIARVLKEKYRLEGDQDTRVNFRRRVNLMLADNERGETITVRLGNRQIELPRSQANGQFEWSVELAVAEATSASKNGFLHYETRTAEERPRVFAGRVQLIRPTGISVISDIDDTIKVTQVTDRKRLLENTFFRDFEAVPGMASRYSGWAAEGIAFHYVSSSPWQLYPPLSEFTQAAGFPFGSFHLKTLRFRDETFFDLFKAGTETKPAQIEAILQRYPRRKFVLVGDSGEQDPEVYAAMMRKHPDQVMRVLIRNVTDATRADDRMSEVFEGLPADRWQLFTEADSMQLRSLSP